MGNQVVLPANQRRDVESLTMDLPQFGFKEFLGGGRFMKTMRCIHDVWGHIVIKVYYKRPDITNLDPYKKQLDEIREKFAGLTAPPDPHVLPVYNVMDEKATKGTVFLIRPYLYANLYHRLSSRPFLGDVEKRWIAFQLLVALAQAHERNVCHGDIKTENVLLTSSCWLYLVDFAPYKPAHLPADNPAEYTYFYDAGNRRRCYLAPERFYETDVDVAQLAQEPLRSSMDIFSAGCVLAEMFNDGTELFDLAKLLSYRKGEHDPAPSLSKLDPHVRDLILHMIQLDPGARLTASQYLSVWGPLLFPPYFEPVLQPFLGKVQAQDPDSRLHTLASALPLLVPQMQVGNALCQAPAAESPSDPDEATPDGAVAEVQPEPDAASPAVQSAVLPYQGLLGNVGNLQMDVQDLLVRLSDAEERAHCPDPSGSFYAGDYLMPDGDDSLLSASHRAPPKREFDVATREFVEFQCRPDYSTNFQPREVEPLGAYNSALRSPEGLVLSREDVSLPEPEGWTWISDWQVDLQSRPTDAEGFVYRRATVDKDPRQMGPFTLRSEYGWASQRSPQHNWRRRRWIRRCQRTPFPASQVQSPSTFGSFRGKSHGMVLIASLLCSSLRGARVLDSKLKGIRMLVEAADLCDDDTRLQRVVPYIMAMVGDAQGAVRCAALRALAAVLRQVIALPPTDLKMFNQYILPGLSLVPADPEEWVRVEFAGIIADLANSGLRLLMGLYHAADQPMPSDPNAPDVLKYEEEVAQLRAGVEKVVLEVAMGQHSSSATRRALLRQLPGFMAFLGRKNTNDFLLPAAITFLNDRDWLLRADFFRHMKDLAWVTGPAGLHAFLMPCLEQALADEEDGVIVAAVQFLITVTERQQLPPRAVLKVASKVAPALLQHPCCAVRGAVVKFVAAAARELPPARAYAQLLPQVLPACTAEPLSLQDTALLSACLRPAGERRPKKPSLPADPPLPQRRGGPHLVGGSSPPAAAVLGPPLPEAAAVPAATVVEPPSPAAVGSREGDPLVLRVGEELPKYVMHVDPKWQRPGTSRLVAALDTAAALPVQAPRVTGSQAQPPAQEEADVEGSSPTQVGVRGGVARLVAAAKRVAAEQGKMRLSPALLSSEQPFSFPLSDPSNQGVVNSIEEAVRTDNEAQGYAGAPLPAAPWHPQGVLIANLAEHGSAVNQIAVAENQAFIATASNDETVKVWDVRRFERDVSFRSRLTYTGQAGRILTCCACEDGQGVASGSSRGSLHVWHVEYIYRAAGVPEYRGIVVSEKMEPEEGAVLRVTHWGGLLLYVTQRGGVHARDLRSPQDAWLLPCRPHEGQFDQLVCDPGGSNWLVTGTNLGSLTLWDVRFQRSVFEWRHPVRGPITAMAAAMAPAARLGLAGNVPRCPLIYVAAGANEVGLWDVEQGRCHQVLRIHPLGLGEAATRAPPEALQKPRVQPFDPASPATLASHLQVDKLERPVPSTHNVRALLATGGGSLITAGSDCSIRQWDGMHERELGRMVAGPSLLPAPGSPGTGPSLVPVAYTYMRHDVGGVPVLEELCKKVKVDEEEETYAAEKAQRSDARRLKAIGLKERIAALCHRDAVTDLAYVNPDPASPNRLLLSCSADGAVKVWK